MTGDAKRIRTPVDPRTWLFQLLTGAAAIVLIHSDRGGLCLFAWCLAVHLITGKGRYVPAYLLAYIVFTGLTWIGVQLLQSGSLYFVGLALSNMGILGRKAMAPLSFAICLSKESAGALTASLQAMRIPKAAGIGLAVLLRFFPTIGGEYRAIRASQRFRGIGVGPIHTLIHLPSTIEYILIPLILRATKVSEELAASITVRGVRFFGETISFRPVRFTRRDALLCMAAVLVPAVLWLLERRGVF